MAPWLHKDPSGEAMRVFSQVSLCRGMGSPHLAPTSAQHLGALAECSCHCPRPCKAVGALEDQAALAPLLSHCTHSEKAWRPPEEVVMGERHRVSMGLELRKGLPSGCPGKGASCPGMLGHVPSWTALPALLSPGTESPQARPHSAGPVRQL